MSEIVPITADEFKAVASAHSVRDPDVSAAVKLLVGQAIRIKQHEHQKNGEMQRCKLVERISHAARYRNMKVSLYHDGPDLLVMRVL